MNQVRFCNVTGKIVCNIKPVVNKRLLGDGPIFCSLETVACVAGSLVGAECVSKWQELQCREECGGRMKKLLAQIQFPAFFISPVHWSIGCCHQIGMLTCLLYVLLISQERVPRANLSLRSKNIEREYFLLLLFFTKTDIYLNNSLLHCKSNLKSLVIIVI